MKFVFGKLQFLTWYKCQIDNICENLKSQTVFQNFGFMNTNFTVSEVNCKQYLISGHSVWLQIKGAST